MVTIKDPSGTTHAVVDATGAAISSIQVGGTEVLWRSPWADEDWDDNFASPDSNAEWHARYPGGWHTLIPNAGDAVTVDGVAHPFHGEAAWRRWRLVSQDAASCTHRIVLRTSPLIVHRRVEAHADGVSVTQEVTSYGVDTVSFTWVEHPAFGPSLAAPGATVTVADQPVDVVVPAADTAGSGHTVTPAGTARLTNPAEGITAELSFDADVFPVLQIWQEHRAERRYPWWGVADALAMEPSAASYASRGEGDPLGPLSLAPGQKLSARLHLRVRPL